MRKSRFMLGAEVGLLCAPISLRHASATVVTFAQFTNQSTTQHNNLQFSINGVSASTPKGTSASLHAFNQSTGDPIYFTYTGFTGELPAGLQGQQSAVLRFNSGQGATTSAAAQKFVVPGLGKYTQQPFDGMFQINFVRTSDFVYKGVDYGSNLLTITIAPVAGGSLPSLVGSTGTGVHSASMSWDSTTFDVTYTSSFLAFPGGADLDGALSFSSILPSYNLASGQNFLTAFTADVTGSFDSDPPPASRFAVPEPSGLSLLGAGLVALGVARRARGRRDAASAPAAPVTA